MIFRRADVGAISLIKKCIDQLGFFLVCLLTMTKVACFCVVLSIFLIIGFLRSLVIKKGICQSSTYVFLLSLKNSHLLITWSLWTVLWLRPGLGWIAPSHMKVDFNLLSSSSFLFMCTGLLFSFFRRLLQWRLHPCYIDF